MKKTHLYLRGEEKKKKNRKRVPYYNRRRIIRRLSLIRQYRPLDSLRAYPLIII